MSNTVSSSIRKKYQTSLIFFAFALFFCIAIQIYFLQMHTREENQLLGSQQSFGQIKQLFNDAIEHQKVLNQFSVEYQSLLSIPIFFNEPRVLWVETLLSIAKRIGLKDFTYTIEAQKSEISEEFTESFQQVDLRQSDMSIYFVGAHEGDLIRFLDELKAAQAGLFTPIRCAMTRSEKIFLHQHNPIVAECKLRWFTIIESNGIDDEGLL